MAFQVTLKPSGHTYSVPEEKSILQAGLDAGFVMPYSCRMGMCRTCKGVVVEGEVDLGDVHPHYFTDSDRSKGYALLCKARPLSDVVIELRELEGAAVIGPRMIPCRVAKIERPTADVAILRLRLPMNENLQFFAGQYIEFVLKGGQRRAYSIATVPSAEGVVEIELHLRHSPGGLFTDHVFSTMQERELLRFEGPLGTFFLREESTKPIIFLASGTGFAPVKSMIEYALRKKIARPMTLYWGGRTRDDLYQFEDAQKWAAQHPHFKFVPVLSDATPACNWHGRTGFVHRAVMEDYPDLSGHQVYACGAPMMVESAKCDFVAQCNLPPDEVFADSFLTESDRAQVTQPRSTMKEKPVSVIREIIKDAIVDPKNEGSVVKPYLLGHGTLECYSLKESRRFYEEFLGLETVRHSMGSMAIRCGLKWHVIGVETGDSLRPCSMLNHWGLDVHSKEAVDAAYKAAVEMKDKYKIRQIQPPVDQHGAYSFYLEDLDHNWWEIQFYNGFQSEDLFDFGDRFSEDGKPL